MGQPYYSLKCETRKYDEISFINLVHKIKEKRKISAHMTHESVP